jgi:hypothetical protein
MCEIGDDLWGETWAMRKEEEDVLCVVGHSGYFEVE